jgi:hypothetical protein
MAKYPSNQLGSLTVGNVVSAAITLYKSNFKRYLQVSLRSIKWIGMTILSTIGAGILGGAIVYNAPNSWILVLPIVLGWLAIILYYSAKYATDRAIISRLAYQELIDSPETTDVATEKLSPRTWGFLRLSLWLTLYMSMVILVSYLLFAIAIGIGISIFTAFNFISNPLAYVSLSLIVIGLIIYLILINFRYYCYWFVSELPLAIESKITARFSIVRSKELSHPFVRELQLIIFIAFLITLPISSVGNSLAMGGQIMEIMANNRFMPVNESSQFLSSGLILIGVLVGTITEFFIMPFWQTIKAVIYYDLVNQQEGRDILL